MAKKPTSFGQFDQGAGQRYAPAKDKPKKRKVNPNPTPPTPMSHGRRRAAESDVLSDMREHRSRVLRMGR